MRRANGWKEFYSLMASDSGKIEVFLDAEGDPTLDYPHVHVIHHGNGRVDVVGKFNHYKQTFRCELHGADGRDVADTIAKATATIRVKRYDLKHEGQVVGAAVFLVEGSNWRCMSISGDPTGNGLFFTDLAGDLQCQIEEGDLYTPSVLALPNYRWGSKPAKLRTTFGGG
jgi:hypothetical protein